MRWRTSSNAYQLSKSGPIWALLLVTGTAGPAYVAGPPCRSRSTAPLRYRTLSSRPRLADGAPSAPGPTYRLAAPSQCVVMPACPVGPKVPMPVACAAQANVTVMSGNRRPALIITAAVWLPVLWVVAAAAFGYLVTNVQSAGAAAGAVAGAVAFVGLGVIGWGAWRWYRDESP